MKQLRLSEWLGWAPSRDSQARNACLLPPEKPGSSVPSMLRRRLDTPGRATCDILSKLDPDARFPLVHASRHGDANFTLAMLKSLADSAPLSPTRFSMSVHNATLGVHAIANHHRRPLQALGASGNEFNALLWEAQGYLAEGYEAVVIVFSEGELPEDYSGLAPHPGSACAVGLRLSHDDGRALVPVTSSRCIAPTPLDVIDWLGGRVPILDAASAWRLEEA